MHPNSLVIMQQPRKCRKCDELRPPEDFPIDPRNASKRTRDCQYCLSDLGDMPPSSGHAPMEGAQLPMGAWSHHLGEYWQLDPARCAPTIWKLVFALLIAPKAPQGLGKDLCSRPGVASNADGLAKEPQGLGKA